MKHRSLESRMRLIVFTLSNGCRTSAFKKIRINGRLRDIRRVAAELEGIKPGTPFLAKACSTKDCIHPRHAPVKR